MAAASSQRIPERPSMGRDEIVSALRRLADLVESGTHVLSPELAARVEELHRWHRERELMSAALEEVIDEDADILAELAK